MSRQKKRSHYPIFEATQLALAEDFRAFDELLAKVFERIKPADILEEIWTRDYVDYQWEAMRLRQFKTMFVFAAAEDEVVRQVTMTFLDQLAQGAKEHGSPPKVFCPGTPSYAEWAKTHGDDAKELEDAIDSAKIKSRYTITAQTYVKELDSIERIDRLIEHSERRRDASLYEIERHRASFAKVLRHNVVDGEFELKIEPRSRREKSQHEKWPKNRH